MIEAASLQEICIKYRNCSPDYYVGNIPYRKERHARSCLRIPDSETVIALVDLTVFGSAKDAIAITPYGLYWRILAGEHHTIPWTEFANYSFAEVQRHLYKVIVFNDGLELTLAGTDKLDTADNHVVIRLLNDIKSCIAGDECLSNHSNELGACEFCNGPVKPGVTFCKHCGIRLRG